ncbi:UDP-2,4-diacetamido-2,4,6-trideoxy-beta-L-altropyranose hydrolase [Natronomonas sp. CBA1123]|uniref:UDP-2,4-diacetamido-2,4, 6-trideoxy-beta-L-altropyranose hydrolase n=1 Tax=Natronomonas sp. CBA1123 TaxID=2668070 RepID=UPI0012EACCE2|nr:UDP-2,4-diacetamido-2,4,6-trideoxy-beta-L-altropyranose hydrolase [Natronomonas sp. CBA1123]MUV85127.1 UDP-2,4-diacetamido-2,4,6-trideoxy-beta-L-altropyranose hydrolase [Natronomonas sp. CBA1123]
MHVTIRADGGPEIGYGHLIRSSALAEELLTRGHTVSYVTTTPEHAAEVCPDAAEITQLPSRTDVEPFVEWLDSTDVDFVFTDAYPVDTEYQRTVRDHTPLAVLQDDARHTVCADVFVNGNLYAEKLDYHCIDSALRKCLGPSYLLLRREVSELAEQNPPWHEEPERAIVTMGGSDTANLTPKILRAFDGRDFRVDAIVGPGFSERQEQEIRQTANEVSTEVAIVRNPEDLYKRMFAADFAVSTSSSTTYELLALGTPIISCPVASNQELIASVLQERNLATVLEADCPAASFRDAIELYLNQSVLRKERRRTGRDLVDGKGATRVCEELLSYSNQNIEP